MLPMSMRAQAHDIIRTWAFYTIVKSLYHTGQIPWNHIMISGFVLAKKGEKISKSKNNTSNTPMKLIESHSADVLRYWAANSKLGTDTFFSEDELKIGKRFITKLWNAAKFVILHLEDYKPTINPKLLPVDQWILERLKQTTSRVRTLLNEYEIGQGRHEIDEFFWKDFCDYYIEIVKERLYQPDKHGIVERLGAQYTIYHVLLGILKLYAIYTPHITEYIFQVYFKGFELEESIHRTIFSQMEELDQNLLNFGEELKELIMGVRKYKSEKNLSMKDPLDVVTIECDEVLKHMFMQIEKDVTACTNSKEIVYNSNRN
jgi:valyl-tRNA synthetase